MFFCEKTFAGIEPPEQRREQFAGDEDEKLQVSNVLRPATGLRWETCTRPVKLT